MLLLVVGCAVYIQQTIIVVNVSIKDNPGKVSTLTLLNNKGDRSGVFHVGSIAFIPRDTGRIEASYNNWQTTVDITPLPWIGVSNVDIIIEPDRNAMKVSGASLGCTVYDKQSNTLASYSCNNPTGLSVYETSDVDGTIWGNKAFLTFPRAYYVTAYQNGLLGITNNTSPQFFYADMSTKTVSLPAIPPSLTPDSFKATSIVTDQTKESNHFLLINTQKGDVHFATANDATIEYRSFTLKKEWFDSETINCALKDTKAYCYVGWTSFDTHSDDKDTANEKSRNDGRFITIDFSENNVSYVLSKVSKHEPIDSIYIDGSGTLFSLSGENLFKLKTDGSEVQRTIVTKTVGHVISGPTLYYISSNHLYEFDSKLNQSKLRFTSKHLRLSTVSQIDQKVYFNAFINGDPGQLLHTYELQNTPNTTPDERLIDKLPIYQNNNQSNIVSMDLSGDSIHIVLPSYVKLDKNDTVVFDEKKYAISKQEAINYLSTYITNLKSYRLTFSKADR